MINTQKIVRSYMLLALLYSVVLILVARYHQSEALMLGSLGEWLVGRLVLVLVICHYLLRNWDLRLRRTHRNNYVKMIVGAGIIFTLAIFLTYAEFSVRQVLAGKHAAPLPFYIFLFVLYLGGVTLWWLSYRYMLLDKRQWIKEDPLIYSSMQITGWSLVLIQWVFMILLTPNSHYGVIKLMAWASLVCSSSLFISHFILRPFFQIRLRTQQSVVIRIIVGGAVCFVSTWLIIYVEMIWLSMTSLPQQSSSGIFVILFMMKFGFLMLWSIMYNAWMIWQLKQEEGRHRLLLERTVASMHLKNLKQQLNPHFLFNALNSLRVMIVKDQDVARDMVSNLASLLRYSLYQSNTNTVTLEQELAYVKSYLSIEELRFKDRLSVSFCVEPDALNVFVVPLSIQTLVENAIKYGSTEDGCIKIEIRAELSGDEIVLSVINSGQRVDESTQGIGLVNTRERLQLIFGKNISVILKQKKGNVVAVITHPIRHAERAN